MAGSDLFELLITFAVVGIIIDIIFYISKIICRITQTTKEALKSKGYNVSSSGVSIKINKRFDHDEYLEATQRGLVRALEASSVGQDGRPLLRPSVVANLEANSHVNGVETHHDHHHTHRHGHLHSHHEHGRHAERMDWGRPH